MKKVSYLQRASIEVPEFKSLSYQFIRKYTIAGKSESCIRNYLLHTSKIVLHYKCTPIELSIEQIEEYLFLLIKNKKYSISSLKHLIYGLRVMFEMFNKEKLLVSLPKIPYKKSLPVVLSQKEIKLLLKANSQLKFKLLFAIIYDCGLRISEVINLKIEDLDFHRNSVHIKQSKHKKDRYVPLSRLTIQAFNKYFRTYTPDIWVFNGKNRGTQISRQSIRYNFKKTIKKAGIIKPVCIHSLRHTYATHLLEMGLDIVSVRNQLGHSEIKTTMKYLHIAQSNPKAGFTPIEKLFSR